MHAGVTIMHTSTTIMYTSTTSYDAYRYLNL
jgi:hypothetical protein